ncbi:DUF3626 domain-containing protein [Phycicoccus sp. CMS6Z-2]|nr:DUF3626 domain-containing protein [Phycicoccus flavus]
MDRSLRVTLNFHPDRVAGAGLTIDALARDGVYRSQFETGTSAGGLTAHPGGDRARPRRRTGRGVGRPRRRGRRPHRHPPPPAGQADLAPHRPLRRPPPGVASNG